MSNKPRLRYSIVLAKSVPFINKSKTGQSRFDARIGPGTFTAIMIPNPSGKKNDSNWLLFEGTEIGATVEYVKSVASFITALS